jgi:hypothetical protein
MTASFRRSNNGKLEWVSRIKRFSSSTLQTQDRVEPFKPQKMVRVEKDQRRYSSREGTHFQLAVLHLLGIH